MSVSRAWGQAFHRAKCFDLVLAHDARHYPQCSRSMLASVLSRGGKCFLQTLPVWCLIDQEGDQAMRMQGIAWRGTFL